jgi:response regulator RpfG family c-di-GMP phosphodiesterase
MELWVIDDDKKRVKRLEDAIKENKLDLKIKWFNILSEAYYADGSPDFILVDVTSITGGPTIAGYFDGVVRSIHHLANKHSSSNFCIVSDVRDWSQGVVKEIENYFGDVIIEDAGSIKEAIQWLKKYMHNKKQQER